MKLDTTELSSNGENQIVHFNRSQFLNAQFWKHPENLFYEALDSSWYRTIGHIFAAIQTSSYAFYERRHFFPMPMPVTCTSISSPFGLGSDSEPVQIDLFGTPTFLADSMQFQLEYVLRQGFQGVYYIMPTFRGENPDERHLNQFFHSELEMQGTLEDVMQLLEQYIHFCTRQIYTTYGSSIYHLGGGVHHIEQLLKQTTPFPRITFAETQRILPIDPRFYKYAHDEPIAFTQMGEKHLLGHFGGPVWVMFYPIQSVPFYQAWSSDRKYAYCADLLMGIGEVAGCGQRHLSYIETFAALEHHRVQAQDYAWYLQMKKHYPLQTSGFGMGIERFILWLLNHHDIRDIPIFNRIRGMKVAP